MVKVCRCRSNSGPDRPESAKFGPSDVCQVWPKSQAWPKLVRIGQKWGGEIGPKLLHVCRRRTWAAPDRNEYKSGTIMKLRAVLARRPATPFEGASQQRRHTKIEARPRRTWRRAATRAGAVTSVESKPVASPRPFHKGEVRRSAIVDLSVCAHACSEKPQNSREVMPSAPALARTLMPGVPGRSRPDRPGASERRRLCQGRSHGGHEAFHREPCCGHAPAQEVVLAGRLWHARTSLYTHLRHGHESRHGTRAPLRCI